MFLDEDITDMTFVAGSGGLTAACYDDVIAYATESFLKTIIHHPATGPKGWRDGFCLLLKSRYDYLLMMALIFSM